MYFEALMNDGGYRSCKKVLNMEDYDEMFSRGNYF